MGITFISPVKEIGQLWLDTMAAGKPVNVVKVVRVGRRMIAIDAKGRLYHNSTERGCFTLGSDLDDTFRALVKLGALTKEQVDKHIAASKEKRKRANQFYAARELLSNAAELGIKLTKAQMAKIEAAKESAK